MVKAIDAVHEAEELVQSLETKLLTLSIARTKAEEQLGAAALLAEADPDGLDAEYQAKVKAVEEIEAYQRRVRQALKSAGSKLQAAKADVHTLGQADLVKTQTRFTVARAKAAERMSAGLKEYAAGYLDLHRANERIAFSWPAGVLPRGALLDASEIANALAIELFRVCPTEVLKKGTPPLPGARPSFGLGNPALLKSFSDTLAEANAYLLQRVAEVPSVHLSIDPVEYVAPALAEPQPVEPAEPAQPVQTRNAVELMAEMSGKRRLL